MERRGSPFAARLARYGRSLGGRMPTVVCFGKGCPECGIVARAHRHETLIFPMSSKTFAQPIQQAVQHFSNSSPSGKALAERRIPATR